MIYGHGRVEQHTHKHMELNMYVVRIHMFRCTIHTYKTFCVLSVCVGVIYAYTNARLQDRGLEHRAVAKMLEYYIMVFGAHRQNLYTPACY